ARPPGEHLRPPPPGAGAPHLPDRRCADGGARRGRGHRGDRGGAHVHVDARGAGRRRPHRHQRGARHAEGQPQHPRRGHGPDPQGVSAMATASRRPDGLPAHLDVEETLVMGALNVTPDSSSDGGEHDDAAAAVAHGRRLVAQGAAIVDVGGESTRPGAPRVDEEEELRRVLPVVSALAADDVVVSVDTMRATVAAASIEAGALIVNDVSAGSADVDMGREAACLRTQLGTPPVFIAMHWRGHSDVMNELAVYEDVARDSAAELAERLDAL